MNEFTKIRDRILARIETYIADIELAEEQELTEDEKTIFESVKEIINEEFEGSVPLPRFIIHKIEKMKQVETADEKIKLKDEEVKKFEKYIDDYKGLPAEDKQRICQDAIRTTDAIIRLSHSYGVSYCVAKDMVMEIMETLKKPPHPTTEHIIKDTIKEYLDKDYDDVTELLLALSKDLCERIKDENEKATAAQLKTECSRKENKPRLSKPAFTVIDHVLKEHEEHEDRFTTFCDGRHQQITVKQINAELDKLYNYFYGKGEEHD